VKQNAEQIRSGQNTLQSLCVNHYRYRKITSSMADNMDDECCTKQLLSLLLQVVNIAPVI